MAATAPTVFITVPKYVAITPSPLPKIRPAPTTTEIVVGSMSPASSGYASSSGGGDESSTTRGKKRRLDHLTWEEKIQRKKLKNRVAAQTSRDRKKARMEEMEHEIDDLTQKTQILQNKCESLQAINDSLLTKNQKLDAELEELRQQLNELQQQQQQQQSIIANHSNAKVTTCAGCESILNGSAAGITTHGLPVVASATTAEKEQHDCSAVADSGPLPTLQDMLLEEFDASKLEELAESLLADIAADMEAGDRACNASTAEAASGTERLLGPVVGTAAERLEPSQHTPEHLAARCVGIEQTKLPIEAIEAQTLSLQKQMHMENTTTSTTTAPLPELTKTDNTPDTVYGTYDAKTNSITIAMDDDAEPVNEAVEEIYCDGVSPPQADDCIKCPTPAASPSQVYLNVVECSDDEDDLNFNPIETFLRPKRPMVSPLAKSPSPSLHSATSDHGYESIIGSPTAPSIATDRFETCADDFAWNDSFNDLFPALI